jgi:peptidoglycan/xylan/chitin deacetylase (PgdA/CDA1 family)
MRAATAAALAALAAAGPAHAAEDRRDGSGPLDLRAAALRQDGRHLVFSVRTEGEWASRAFTSRAGRSLCLVLSQAGRRGFACAAATTTGRHAMTFTPAGGNPRQLAASIDRPSLRSLTARFAAGAVALRTGRFSWAVTSTWADARGCAPARPPCRDRLPDRGSVAAVLRPPAPAGCVPRSPSYRTNGARGRRAVSLTFDDGPGPYTGAVLDVLRRHGARGTFFVIGQQVGGGARVLRRALREGHAIGNHSWNHANLAGGGAGQIAATQRAVRRATGYSPCVFRAPYGAVSGTLIAQARGQGLNTIQWDVDPRDWSSPGTGAIQAGGPAAAARVLGAVRPGSIVVMHDGGGPRGQTVAALPGILRTLRRRGYRLVTVPELLGLRPRYG